MYVYTNSFSCEKEGHVEKRKKYQSTWTIEEVGDVEADGVAGGARLGAKKDEDVVKLRTTPR
jgi:hypothetical protein